MNEAKRHVDMVLRLMPENFYYRFLMEHGQEMPLLAATGTRPSKECYSNSLREALETGHLYCEGMAISKSLSVPIEHAWVLTPDGVLDTTWKYDSVEYFGVVFDPKKAEKAMCEMGYYGIFGNLFLWKKETREALTTSLKELLHSAEKL